MNFNRIHRKLEALHRERVESVDALRVWGPGVQQTLAGRVQARADRTDYDPVADLSERIWQVPLVEAQRRYDAWCRAFTEYVRNEIGEAAFSTLRVRLDEVDADLAAEKGE